MLINGVLEKPIVEYSNYSLSHPIPLCPVLSIFCPFQGWFSLKMRIFFFYKPSSVSDIASESQLEKEWSQLKKEWRPSLGGCSALCPRDGHRAKKKKIKGIRGGHYCVYFLLIWQTLARHYPKDWVWKSDLLAYCLYFTAPSTAFPMRLASWAQQGVHHCKFSALCMSVTVLFYLL